MKTSPIPSMLCALALAILPSSLRAAEVLSVAVFDFESKDEAVRDLGPKVSTLINAGLSAEPELILVERAELEKALGEQELSLSGTVSADTAAKVGHLTGAKVLVTGRVFRVEKELFIVVKIIGTETSRVYGELVKGGAAASISDLAMEMAGKIAATISGKGDTLVAKVVTREQRIARLQASLGAGKRPSVSVRIPEQHYGAPAIDPAAETEFGKLLGECGFTLIGPADPKKADFEITGEAFSAHAMRKGNLVSCRARVEIKIQRADGTLLLMDRQTSVSVDIAEQIAAKDALAEAAFQLAERVLPKLTR